MRYLIACLFALGLAMPAVAEDGCTVAIDELPADTQSHLSNRIDRIDDLVEMFEELETEDERSEFVDDLVYWAAMADSAALRRQDITYPACEEYQALEETYKSVINDVYALAGQLHLLATVGLANDFQIENVQVLFQQRTLTLIENLATWNNLYEAVQSQ